VKQQSHHIAPFLYSEWPCAGAVVPLIIPSISSRTAATYEAIGRGKREPDAAGIPWTQQLGAMVRRLAQVDPLSLLRLHLFCFILINFLNVIVYPYMIIIFQFAGSINILL
jgi:hypothetical protein